MNFRDTSLILQNPGMKSNSRLRIGNVRKRLNCGIASFLDSICTWPRQIGGTAFDSEFEVRCHRIAGEHLLFDSAPHRSFFQSRSRHPFGGAAKARRTDAAGRREVRRRATAPIGIKQWGKEQSCKSAANRQNPALLFRHRQAGSRNSEARAVFRPGFADALKDLLSW